MGWSFKNAWSLIGAVLLAFVGFVCLGTGLGCAASTSLSTLDATDGPPDDASGQYEHVAEFAEEHLYSALQSQAKEAGLPCPLVPGSEYTLGGAVPWVHISEDEVTEVETESYFPIYQNNEPIAWVYALPESQRKDPDVAFGLTRVFALSEQEAECLSTGLPCMLIYDAKEKTVQAESAECIIVGRDWMVNAEGEWYPETYPKVHEPFMLDLLKNKGYDLSPEEPHPSALSDEDLAIIPLSDPSIRIPLMVQER